MNYMNIVPVRIYRPASNFLSSHANEPKFWIYMCSSKDPHITTVATEKHIDNFKDLKQNLYSGL